MMKLLAFNLDGAPFALTESGCLAPAESESIPKPDEALITLLRNLAQDFRLVCVSSCMRETVVLTLTRLGVFELFERVYSNDDADTPSTPSTSLARYEQAMREAHVLPSETLIIEDSVVGHQAARESGAHVMRIANQRDIATEPTLLQQIRAELHSCPAVDVDIVPFLMGGIGNRLFQLAAAHHVARELGARVTLDPDCTDPNLHKNDSENAWFFRHLPVVSHQSPIVLEEVWGQPPHQLVDRVRAAIGTGSSRTSCVVIKGYFQCEAFFRAPRDAARIREWFTWPDRIEEVSLPEKSFAIHIRRGDYVNHPCHELLTGPSGLHGYYARAVQEFPKDAEGVVFSDDIAWCREHYTGLSAHKLHFVDETLGGFRSLQLMSRCPVGIVMANSSFSWWAAWLNPNPTKRVTMPNRWFGPQPGMPTFIAPYYDITSYTPVVVDLASI